MIGRKLANRYQIIEKVGGGGMAIVYKARCTLLNRVVAVKVLRPQFVHDEEFIRKFRREAQSSASLSHPNIVGVYDVGQEKSNYFIVMEYVDGMTLKEYIQQQGVIEPQEALRIAKEVAEALVHAHENSIIHRDIKPHNILLTQSRRVKVTDFGIAKAITSNTLTAQNTGSIMGSVHYFSPEQAKGNYTGAQSDIYSLGIVMYEMLTGQLPFDGESPISIAIKHIQEKVKPIKEIKPDIPSDIEDLVEKCLQKNKDLRYNNISELLEDIKQWLKFGKVDVELIEENLEQHTQVFGGVSKGALNQADGQKKPTDKKRKSIVIASLVVGIILLLTLGFFGLRNAFFVPEVTVPNVENLPLREAVDILKQKGLEYNLTEDVYSVSIPRNSVVYQNPTPNTRVKRGRVVQLTLSGGPQLVPVPDVTGLDERAARINLEQAGFAVEFDEEFSETVQAGRAIRQNPLGGNEVRGATVTVVMSLGPQSVQLPDIIGSTVEEAREILRNLNINVRYVVYQPSQGNSPSGIVTGHSHEGTTIQPGSSIDLNARPFEEKTRSFKIENEGIEQPYSLRVVVTDLAGQRTIFDSVVDPDEGDVQISINYWEKGEVEFFRNNESTDKRALP